MNSRLYNSIYLNSLLVVNWIGIKSFMLGSISICDDDLLHGWLIQLLVLISASLLLGFSDLKHEDLELIICQCRKLEIWLNEEQQI